MKSVTRVKFYIVLFSLSLLLVYFYKRNLLPNPTKFYLQKLMPYNNNNYLETINNNVIISESQKDSHKQTATSEKKQAINIAVVVCGDRIQETLNMIKSALMFSGRPLNVIIIAEDNLMLSFKEKLSEWQIITNHAFAFTILPLTFPKGHEGEWKKLFKPCASQRLFLPSVLRDIDSVIYVDTDTLFLAPIEQVWDHFYKMNSSQIAALAPEHEDPHIGWYNRFARHPYYGPFGVNSGVMLMNLTRMRSFQWRRYVIPIYQKYKLNITWGDQDIINIIFHYYPEKLYIYPCRFNYRSDHCRYMSICKSAEKDGVVVLHGSRGFFHSPKEPLFQAIYRSFEEYQIGTDKYTNFLQPLEGALDLTSETNCGRVKDIFLKNIKLLIRPVEDESS